jgi:hypothetical protein
MQFCTPLLRTACITLQDSELLELRQTIELLRKQSVEAGLTSAHIQSMSPSLARRHTININAGAQSKLMTHCHVTKSCVLRKRLCLIAWFAGIWLKMHKIRYEFILFLNKCSCMYSYAFFTILDTTLFIYNMFTFGPQAIITPFLSSQCSFQIHFYQC